jgi:hypothetical protein
MKRGVFPACLTFPAYPRDDSNIDTADTLTNKGAELSTSLDSLKGPKVVGLAIVKNGRLLCFECGSSLVRLLTFALSWKLYFSREATRERNGVAGVHTRETRSLAPEIPSFALHLVLAD